MTEGVTLLTCSYNSEKYIVSTLHHLAKLNLSDGFPVELLIVDNASADKTVLLAKEIWKQLGNPFPMIQIPELKPGLTHARKTGIMNANYEYIIYVDHDNWLDKDYAQNVFRILQENPEIGALGGQSIGFFESKKPKWFDQFEFWYAVGKQGKKEGIPDLKSLFGAGLAFRKTVIDAIFENGFRTNLTSRDGSSLNSGDDDELCKAIMIAGWKIHYTPQLRLHHFMDSFRLSWPYFKELNKGESRALIFLLAYEYWVVKEMQDRKRFRSYRYSWAFLIMKTSIKIMLYRTRIVLDPELKNEGSRLPISLDRELILFDDLTKKRSEFVKLKKKIGNARWRNLASKIHSKNDD